MCHERPISIDMLQYLFDNLTSQDHPTEMADDDICESQSKDFFSMLHCSTFLKCLCTTFLGWQLAIRVRLLEMHPSLRKGVESRDDGIADNFYYKQRFSNGTDLD